MWLCLGIASAASATIMVEIPLRELAHGADAVVHARVERVGSFVAVEEGRVIPFVGVDLRVDTWLRGSGPTAIQLRERGGPFPDGSVLHVEGTPHYASGEEVVVFLRRRDNGTWRTHEMAQGKFEVLPTVSGGPHTLRRDLSEVTLLDESGQPTHGGHQQLSFSSLLRALSIDQVPSTNGSGGLITQ